MIKFCSLEEPTLRAAAADAAIMPLEHENSALYLPKGNSEMPKKSTADRTLANLRRTK